jgi:hypothetical protein
MTDLAEPLTATPGAPIPANRGRWRMVLANRAYGTVNPLNLFVADISDARSRKLDQTWNKPAQLTFTLNGHSPTAALISELAQEVIVWRWDETSGSDIVVFRGVVTATEDQVTEQSATLNVTCMDYSALLARRVLTATLSRTQTDQDNWVSLLLGAASAATSSSGQSFVPGSNLSLAFNPVDPSGAGRGPTGQLRDRTYLGNQNIGDAIANLAAVINGFDFDVRPRDPTQYTVDQFRVFYPNQGVLRPDVLLMYGTTIAAFTRSITSSAYSNYVRLLGHNGDSDPAAPQMFSEAFTADASSGTVGAVGLWMTGDNAADVTIQSTLDQQAQGTLALDSVLQPTYSLTFRPGGYSWGNPNMGDTCPLVLKVGRLNVNTNVRVLGISYTVGDDGEEDVSLTVGRPDITLPDLLTKQTRDINALARR